MSPGSCRDGRHLAGRDAARGGNGRRQVQSRQSLWRDVRSFSVIARAERVSVTPDPELLRVGVCAVVALAALDAAWNVAVLVMFAAGVGQVLLRAPRADQVDQQLDRGG